MSDVLADGTIFAGDYRVIRVIHAGGLSTLYEVEQVSTGVRRALKVVAGALGKDEKLRELFLEEAKRVGRIQSDHVAELLSCGVDASTDLPFAILELVQGETLAELMIRRGSLGPREALDLLEQISHAVAAAHDVGLVHRDLKPEGILIGQSRSKSATARVVVLFLGVGKLASEAKHNTTAAMSRPLWMAPEQTETDVTPTAATDVWAQGLLAYHLLTGRHYWKTARDMGSAMMSLMREVLFEDFAKASERAREQGVIEKLPYGFDPWFARCVVRDRAQRFQHAREAMQELGACLAPFAATEELRQHAPSAATPPPAAFGPLPPIARPPLASGSYPPGPQLPPPSMPPPRGPLPPLPTPPPPKPASGPPVGLIAAAIAALVVLAALGIGIGVFYLRASRTAHVDRDDEGDQKTERTTKKPSPWSDEACPVPVSSKDPTWGDRLAPVTIVEFSDYQCPFCKKADETLVDLETLYGKTKLRIVWKNNPLAFHPNARPAALAARAVFELEGDDAFWRFHQSAFADQKGLAPDAYSRWAAAAGVDKRSFESRKDDAAVAKKIDDDLALGASIGVKGTPAFFINGRALVGAQPKEKFQNAIDLALAEAQAETKQGTPADKIYVTLTQRNYKKDAPPDPTPTPDDHTLYRVPVGASPVRGPKNALVTIVEFGDFQCPFCAKSEGTLNDLTARYPGKIRIVWKDSPLPMHARAMAAANFAREVRAKKGDDGFWKAHDLLFTNQKRLEDADLSSYGLDLGVDGVSLVAAAQSEKHKKEISEDQDLADALGATGTPVFYINGRKLIGAVAVDKFAQLVDEELPKAQAFVQAGTPAEAVYDELTKNGSVGKELEKKEPGPIPVGAPTRGANKPLVVIQEFSDLQCPFCKRAETTLDDVLRDYGDKVQIVWRHDPLDFHKDAHLAAEASEEVKAQKGNDAFFKFKTKAFAAQPNGLDRAGLERMANDLGLDMLKFRRSLDDHTHSARVDADVSAAKALGFTGTPTFLVGKFVITGAQPESAFRRAIDRALAEPK